ncbi:hypothetical protein HL653_01980 [Sphingomonas sp. AP4-R1]|uniref:hypothetical protein n=1 Tax=Sphingomonas sp. AP4-R1 TaxID=2735134 RepID=UPI0014934EEE|nr:hypothetical protein [Sphingomonas sp. AP4-R1]QJU56715.1 hypothetical protein HL653_01980 [Sphingomonas sp. AP4-R1]
MDGMGLVAAIGGLLLALALLWAVIGNRRRTPEDRRRTEEATRAMKLGIDREDRVADADPSLPSRRP